MWSVQAVKGSLFFHSIDLLAHTFSLIWIYLLSFNSILINSKECLIQDTMIGTVDILKKQSWCELIVVVVVVFKSPYFVTAYLNLITTPVEDICIPWTFQVLYLMIICGHYIEPWDAMRPPTHHNEGDPDTTETHLTLTIQ